jgi:flagellar hook-associated protein 2
MATITFSGLATGLDSASLIDQLVQIERQPITSLEKRQATLQKNVTLLQELNSKLSAVKSAATKLSTATSFFVKKVTNADETSLGVSAGSNADVGTHLIAINALARASTLASASFNDTTTTTVGTGTLDISVGATTKSITIDSSNNTLQGIRDAINDSDIDVTASIIPENDGPNPTYRLAVVGKNTGTVNTITIDTSGLTRGASDVALNFTTTQAAQDASLTIDGIAISRSNNTISDAISGVTLDAKATSTSAIQVTVNDDTEAIKTQVNDFIQAYNDVQSFISTQTKYDSTTKTAGPLTGDSALRSLQRSLASVIATTVTGTPSILAEVGVSTQKDGTLSVDETKFSNALQTNLEGVSNLFLSASNGVATTAIDYITQATRSGDGLISGRISSIQDTISEIGKQIDRKTDDLDRYRDSLVLRFTSLETLVSQLQGQGQFLAQHLSSLNA